MKESSPSEAHGPGIVPGWLARLCAPSRVLWLAPVLGFVLTLPSVFSGYMQDDHRSRQSTLERSIFPRRPAWDIFHGPDTDAEVARCRERGIAQANWWTPDTTRSRFFRPLASLLLAFEFRFFGDSPWVMHVNRALLYALIVLVGACLLRRVSTTPIAFGIACLIFAIDDTHAYSSGWISAANTLLACLFGFFALLMHDRWRRDGSVAGLALSLAAFVLALLSSEGGLALMGYLVAYALFLEPDGWKRKVGSLLPTTVIAVGYLAFYAAMGLGIKGSFDYLSPGEDPLLTAFVVLSGTVTGTVSQLVSVMPLGWAFQTGIAATLTAAFLLVGLVVLFRGFLRSSRAVGFFGVGMVLSIVPFTVGMMSDRYLLWAGLGAAGLLGELFVVHPLTSKLQRATAKTLLVTNTIVSLIFFVPTLFWLSMIERGIRAAEQTVTSANTVVLNGHSIATGATAALRCEKGGEWPAHFYLLYEGVDPITVTRTGDRTLLATTPKGWFSSSFFSRGARPKELRFRQGQTFELQLMTATIEELTEDGRPRSVSFSFKEELSAFDWLRWTLNGPRRMQPPALGESIQASPWQRE